MVIAVILLLISFYLLAIVTDEFFVGSLDKISGKLKLSSEVAGATFMAVGSSAPELFTALFAVFKITGGGEGLGAGTIVGSAIFNILVIIGASAMFRRAKITWQPVLRDLLFYCFAIILLLIVFANGVVTLPETIMFLGFYAVYVYFVANWGKWFKYKSENLEIVAEESKKNPVNEFISNIVRSSIPGITKNFWFAFVVSILMIMGLSFVLVESAVVIASSLGVSQAIIGLTVLAAGTSVPDLLSSLIVAKKGRGDMAIANAVGSNIFDILFGLGFSYFIYLVIRGGTITVDTENLFASIVLLFATVIAVLFILVMRKWHISPRSGSLLIILYLLYLGYNIGKVLGVL